MNPQSLPAALGSSATRICLAAGCGAAGSVAALTLMHKTSTPVLAAGAVTAALAVNAAASAFRSLPGIIDAINSLITAFIRARADAKATVIHAQVRAELARAGLDPRSVHQAVEMQRLLPMNPDLPAGRRPADETLIKLQAAFRTRSGSSESATSSDTTPGNPNASANKVVPIRPEN